MGHTQIRLPGRPFHLPGRRQRVHLLHSAEDGHSPGEQTLYLALWHQARPETADSRLITIGYGAMQDATQLDRTNCKKNIQSLIQKLAIDVDRGYDARTNAGYTYRVYSPDRVHARRLAAGLRYLIRTSGVRLLTEQEIFALLAGPDTR